MSKKLLVVVDYQNDFVDGALGFEKATKIAPYIISLVKKYEEEGEDVWFTIQRHRKVRIYLYLIVSHRQKEMNFMENCSL